MSQQGGTQIRSGELEQGPGVKTLYLLQYAPPVERQDLNILGSKVEGRQIIEQFMSTIHACACLI